MTTALTIIEQKLTSDSATQALTLALGLDPADEKSRSEAFKFASSVLAEVRRSAGAEYGDLTQATPDSIMQAMIDAATFKISLDGRKLAHMEVRYEKGKGKIATLQIDTNGFVAKIKEYHPDAEFSITTIFKGDEAEISGAEGQKKLRFTSKNPFGGEKDLTGIMVQISYKVGDRLITDVQPCSIEDLNVMKSKAKGTAFKDFPLERMKTAALKRACKWHFRQNSMIQAIIDYDNKNFDPNQVSAQPASPVRTSIVDRINKSLAEPEQKTIEHEPLPPEEPETPPPAEPEAPADTPTPAPVDAQAVEKAARGEAGKGVAAYTAWLAQAKPEEKAVIKALHAELTKIAKSNEAKTGA